MSDALRDLVIAGVVWIILILALEPHKVRHDDE